MSIKNRYFLCFFVLIFSFSNFANTISKKISVLEKSYLISHSHEQYIELFNTSRNVLDDLNSNSEAKNKYRLNLLIAKILVRKLREPMASEKYIFNLSNYKGFIKTKKQKIQFLYLLSEYNYLCKKFKSAKKTLNDLLLLLDYKDTNDLYNISTFTHALATVFYTENNYDSAYLYTKKAIYFYEKIPKFNKRWLYRCQRELITIDFQQNRFEYTNLIIIQNILKSIEKKDNDLKLDFILLESEYLLNKKEYTLALKSLDKANLLISDVGINLGTIEIFNLYSTIYKLKGDFNQAYNFNNTYFLKKNEIERKDLDNQFSFTKFLYDLSIKDHNLLKLKLENKNIESDRKIILIFSFVTLFTLILSIIFIVSINKRNNKYKKLMLENIALKNKEINHKEMELGNFAFDINRHSEYINNLILHVQDLVHKSNFENVFQLLNNLIFKLKTDKTIYDKTAEINYKLENIKSNFYLKLEDKYDNLTNDEKLLSSLIKIGLSQLEIATFFAIESSSLKTKKYRLKKKLGLSVKEDLHMFLKSL